MNKDELCNGTTVIVSNPRSTDFERHAKIVDDSRFGERKIKFQNGFECTKSLTSLEPVNELSLNPFSCSLEIGDRVRVESDCSTWHQEGTVCWKSMGRVGVDLDGKFYSDPVTYIRSSLAKLKEGEPGDVGLPQPTVQDLIQEFSSQEQKTAVLILYTDLSWEMFESEQQALDEIDEFEDESRVAFIVDAVNPREVVRRGISVNETEITKDWYTKQE